MSTLRVDNLNARTGTTISVPSGTRLYAPGSVVQVQQTDFLSTWSASSATPVDVTGMSVSITPISTSSKILVSVAINIGGPDDNYIYVLLLRNGVSIGTGNTATSTRINTFLTATQTLVFSASTAYASPIRLRDTSTVNKYGIFFLIFFILEVISYLFTMNFSTAVVPIPTITI